MLPEELGHCLWTILENTSRDQVLDTTDGLSTERGGGGGGGGGGQQTRYRFLCMLKELVIQDAGVRLHSTTFVTDANPYFHDAKCHTTHSIMLSPPPPPPSLQHV